LGNTAIPKILLAVLMRNLLRLLEDVPENYRSFEKELERICFLQEREILSIADR